MQIGQWVCITMKWFDCGCNYLRYPSWAVWITSIVSHASATFTGSQSFGFNYSGFGLNDGNPIWEPSNQMLRDVKIPVFIANWCGPSLMPQGPIEDFWWNFTYLWDFFQDLEVINKMQQKVFQDNLDSMLSLGSELRMQRYMLTQDSDTTWHQQFPVLGHPHVYPLTQFHWLDRVHSLIII